jgi:nucleoside-diphosphate-sugar epimerase
MRVLVTGTDGYIGCRLAPWLADAGHEVEGWDTGYYRDGWMYTDPASRAWPLATRRRDLRGVLEHDLLGYDAVVHLAELSNDPLGENDPAVTYQINHQGSVALALAARAAGVGRFVYASSCSVYGVGSGEFLDERTAPNPQTAYARCKVLVERDLSAMGDDRFCVTFLRNATAYGPSPRMRFDIVLNDLCARARTSGLIAMTSDGSPWRPLVHIEDICHAFERALAAPWEVVNREVFNVGATQENYRVREIAATVAEAFPGCQVTVGPSGGDNRSYRVNFDKIATRLPGYAPRWTARAGALELRALFERIEFDAATYQFRAYTRLRQLQYLRRTGQIDEAFYWAKDPSRPPSGAACA